MSYDGSKIIAKEIDLSKIGGLSVDASGITNGQVLAFNSKTNKLVPADKDLITADDISTTGEANKIVRLNADGILNADISGSASILGGVEVNVKGVNDGDILVYHTSTNSFKPEAKTSGAGDGKYLVLKKGSTILCEYNGAANVELDISPLTETVGEAEKLKYPRKITLTGKATGEGTFDGSKNCEINVTKISTTYADSSDTATTATKAEKLTTPRKISIAGKVTAGAVNFDGSSDVVLNVTAMDNPDSAKKLATARKISVTGDAEGFVYFDGSGDVTLNLSVLKSLEVTNPVAETSFAKLAGSANYAAECAKALSAINDNDGNPITETYAKKSELEDLQASLTANTDVSNADEVEENFITREELMEILAQYVTKIELKNAVADVIGEDEITGLFEGGI